MAERLPTNEIDTTLIRLNYGAEEGEELSPRAAVSALCDVVDELRDALEVAEAQAVPEGWVVQRWWRNDDPARPNDWWSDAVLVPIDIDTGEPDEDYLPPPARLVPLSPTDTPEEA